LTHELFHVGHGSSLGYAKEDPLEDGLKNEFLMTLHAEGIATYVGYTINDVFPSIVQDYVMMNDPHTVSEKIAHVNAIFEKADTTQADKLRKLSWDVGVGERAYYVTGGHMARTIDQNLGRGALVSTIENGPLSFIDTYNELVPKQEQIIRFAGPDKNSSILRLKQAALSGDDSAIDEIKLEMATKNTGKEKQLAASLNSLGYKIYYAFGNPQAAIKVLTVGTEFDPNAAYILDSIGEIYLLEKDYASSEKFCRKALELDPHLASSINMLKINAEMRKSKHMELP
jgi:tetratricopeptide (TPR) repeat protein